MIGSHEPLVTVWAEEILFSGMCPIVSCQFIGPGEKLATANPTCEPVARVWPFACSETSVNNRAAGSKKKGYNMNTDLGKDGERAGTGRKS